MYVTEQTGPRGKQKLLSSRWTSGGGTDDHQFGCAIPCAGACLAGIVASASSVMAWRRTAGMFCCDHCAEQEGVTELRDRGLKTHFT